MYIWMNVLMYVRIFAYEWQVNIFLFAWERNEDRGIILIAFNVKYTLDDVLFLSL